MSSGRGVNVAGVIFSWVLVVGVRERGGTRLDPTEEEYDWGWVD